MKIQIRENIFETNSSSCHTLSVMTNPNDITMVPFEGLHAHSMDELTNIDSYLTPRSKKITIKSKDYGWDGPSVYLCKDKIDYLWTYYNHMIGSHYGSKPTEESKEEFENIIKDIYPNLKGINFQGTIKDIDHESANLLAEESIDFKDFLTKPYRVNIENDNGSCYEASDFEFQPFTFNN